MPDNKELVVNEDFMSRHIASNLVEAWLFHSWFSHHCREINREPSSRSRWPLQSRLGDREGFRRAGALRVAPSSGVREAESQPRESCRGIEWRWCSVSARLELFSHRIQNYRVNIWHWSNCIPRPSMSTRMMPAPGFVEMEWLIASALNGDGNDCCFQKIIFPTRVSW